MATVIQIKRSTGSSAPATSNLAEGELAYVQDRSNSGAGAKLYIESVDSDNLKKLIKTYEEFTKDRTFTNNSDIDFIKKEIQDK